MKHFNINNYNWNNGHGAFASGVAVEGGLYKLGTHIATATREQRLAQQQYQLAQARI